MYLLFTEQEAQYVLFSIPLEKKDINRVRICRKHFSASLKHLRTSFSLPKNDVKLWTRIQRGSSEEESTAWTLYAPFFSLCEAKTPPRPAPDHLQRKSYKSTSSGPASESMTTRTLNRTRFKLVHLSNRVELYTHLTPVITRGRSGGDGTKPGYASHQLAETSGSTSLSEISSWISSVFPESLLATELKEGEFLPPLIIRLQVSICTSRPRFMLHISMYSCRCRFMSLFAVASSI